MRKSVPYLGAQQLAEQRAGVGDTRLDRWASLLKTGVREFIKLLSPLLCMFTLFHCGKLSKKKKKQSNTQLPDTNSLKGLRALPGL